jgi:hypothetical protein
MSALANPAITLSKFLQLPEVQDDTSIISKVLGRALSHDDILSKDTVRHIFVDIINTST